MTKVSIVANSLSPVIWVYTVCQKAIKTVQQPTKETNFVVVGALRVNKHLSNELPRKTDVLIVVCKRQEIN